MNFKTNDRLRNVKLKRNYASLVCIWNHIFSPLFPIQQLQAYLSYVNIKHLFCVNHFPFILGRNIRFKSHLIHKISETRR